MQITEKVYSELRTQARRMKIMQYSSLQSEYDDIIQQAAITLFNQKKEPKDQIELEKMCCMALKSKAIDFFRKKKLHIYQSEQAYELVLNNLAYEENQDFKEIMHKIKQIVSKEEYEWMMNYLEKKDIPKTNTEKTHFYRLKEKIRKKLLTHEE